MGDNRVKRNMSVALTVDVVKSYCIAAVTLFYLISSVYGTSTSNEITNLCSATKSTAPYCNCTTISSGGTTIFRVDCSQQSRLVIPSGIPSYANYLSFKTNSIGDLKKNDFPGLEVLQYLDLSYNSISTIEKGTFDKLYRLKSLYLNNNDFVKIESFFFRQLSSLTLIDLSYNRIERVFGDAFLTLPAINKIGLSVNVMQCDCETRKLKQWLNVKPDVTLLDALCVNKNNQPVTSLGFNQFGGCTGQDLFSINQRCHGCAASTSHRACLETNNKLICDASDPNNPFVCYTKMHFTSNGLEIWKGCDSYKTTLQKSRVTNPASCYNSSGPIQCNFYCVGDYCNNNDIGTRTKIINLNATFVLDSEMKPEYSDPSSASYQSFVTLATAQMEEQLSQTKTLGTFYTELVSLSEPKITAEFLVECTTLSTIKEKSVFDYVIARFEALSTLHREVIVNFEVYNDHVCSAQTLTTPKGTFLWPATEAGYDARVICPGNRQYAFRTCELVNGVARWGAVDESKCVDTTTPNPVTTTSSVTDDLTNLAKQTVTDENADRIASDLVSLSRKASSFSGTDVNLTVSILQDLVNLSGTKQRTDRETNIAATMSNFLESPLASLSRAETDFEAPSRFLKTVEDFTDNMDVESNSFESVNPNLALFARKSTDSSFSGFAIETDVKPGEKLSKERIRLKEGTGFGKITTSTIILPSTLASQLAGNQKAALSKVSFAVYTTGKLFSAISNPSPINDNVVSDDSFITGPNSLILSASVPNVNVINLSDPILLRFQHDKENSKNPQCSFWDKTGKWSSEGCVVKETIANEYTVCECDHLTNFALIMDIYGTGSGLSEENKKALTIISYIGCGISLFGLLMTIITYILFEKLRSSNPSKILMNLCIALAATNTIFLLGQQAYTLKSKPGCKVVAIFMHYFLLSAMVWMVIEAFYMYLALVKIFNTYISRFLLKSSLVGWGIPLVVVIITLGVNGTDNYGFQAGDICWLVPNAFYAAFLAPVILILILNFISFVLVTRTLFGVSTKRLTKSDRSKTSARLRGAVSVVVLLGLTWVFAIFAVDGGGIVFQYLFTIFNSLQGLFIFFFYCLLNKEAQKHWKRKLPCFTSSEKSTTQTSKGYSSSSPNDTSSTADVSGMNRARKNSEVALTNSDRRNTDDFPSNLGSSA